MGESRPPFRAAFWAISAALVLMLMLTLSDPYKVRQSILAQHAPSRRTVNPDQTGNPLLADTGEAAAAPQPDELPTTHPGVDSSAWSSHEVGVSQSLAQAQIVSSNAARSNRMTGQQESSARPAMPILSPSSLQSDVRPGRFEELPSPPEWDASDTELVLESNPFSAESSSGIPAASPAELQQLQLEAELLTLRSELAQLNDLRNSDQVQTLQQQQTLLQDRQQQTAVRLDRLTDHLQTQTVQLEQLLARAESFAPPSALAETSPSQPANLPLLETSATGRERFSLIIESEDVSGILERLGHWSRESPPIRVEAPPVEPTPAAAVTPREVNTPSPAPPAGKVPAATHTRISSGRSSTVTGPVFVAPCNCR